MKDPNYEGKGEPQKDENGNQIGYKYFIRLKPLLLRQNPQNNQTQNFLDKIQKIIKPKQINRN